MFQKVMVQANKKKEKSIINRIIVDVFQLNKLKTNQPLRDRHTHTYTVKPKHTDTQTKPKPNREDSLRRGEHIYCKESATKKCNFFRKQLGISHRRHAHTHTHACACVCCCAPLDRLFPIVFPFFSVGFSFSFFVSIGSVSSQRDAPPTDDLYNYNKQKRSLSRP